MVRTGSGCSHAAQHLRAVDMATEHSITPGIPGRTGSKSGVEFKKVPKTAQIKSAGYLSKQFCLGKGDINVKRWVMLLL